MVSIPFPDLVASAAACLSGRSGAVTSEARRLGVSRQAVHGRAARLGRIFDVGAAPGPSRADLARQNEELRRENCELRARLGAAVEFPEPRRREFAARAVALGLSLDQVVDLLRSILDGAAPARSTVHRWVVAAAEAAGAALRRLDRRCSPLVETACLDEIHFHGRPVLVGVEPASMAVMLTTHAGRLTRRAWLAALRPFKALSYVVSDAGTVLRSAVARLQAVRRRVAAPPLETGLDLFHAAKAATAALKILWNRVKKDWKAAEAADAKLARTRLRGEHANRPAATARAAWNAVERSMSRHDSARDAWRHARAAFEPLRPDGRLNNREWAETRIAEALPALAGDPFSTLRGLLGKPDALAFLDRLHRRLNALGLTQGLLDSLVRLWRLQRTPPDPLRDEALLLRRLACSRLDPRGWADAYRRTAAILRDPGRSSSLVECVNSVLRMHQSRHRTLSRRMLDLKRLYWNTRPFRCGKRKGRCPYEHLGLPLPSYDFWTILQNQAESPSPA